MTRKPTTGPTEREAEILAILWQAGEADVEEIRQKLSGTPSPNTVRTLLGIMAKRGLIRDDGKSYGRKFRAKVAQTAMQRSSLRRLMDTFFEGSAAEVILCLADEGEIDAEKLAELQKRLRSK